jgi:minimal PKS chain-length factor (CLF/KS beta)
VVTGVGVVAPTGIGTEEHWAAVLRGERRVQVLDEAAAAGYPTVLGARVRDFEPAEHVDERLLVQTDRWTWHSLAAAAMALRDAGYDPANHDPYATSVFLASGSGGNEFGQREIEALWSRGRRAVGAYQSIAWFYAASTGQVSIRHGAKGASAAVVSEGAGGVDSIGWARRALRRGSTAALVGGTEAGLSPYALVCQSTSGLLSTRRSADSAYRPFDVDADGYAPGEGGAVLLIEDAGAAANRGAPQVYGRILGYAATHDAYHHERVAPDAGQLARALRAALADAGVPPAEVDLVVADGIGTPDGDALEVAAIREVFGERAGRVPVTTTAGLTGRLMAGGSALSVVTALLSIRDGVIPPVGNLAEPVAGYGLDFVRDRPRSARVRTVLVNARGYGGFNAALVVGAADASQSNVEGERV